LFQVAGVSNCVTTPYQTIDWRTHMRWLFLSLTLGSVAAFFYTDSPGVIGLSMLGFFVFGIGAVLTFAQARIDATAQSHTSMLASREVQTLRQQGLQKKVANSKSHQRGAVGAMGVGNAGDGGRD
jgi:hypothetical protein